VTQTVILPTWTGNLSQEKKLELIDDVRWRILPDARAAQAEVYAIGNCAPQDMEALAEADYLGHLLTNLLLTLVIEEDGVK
jgi:hypothetical protein